MFSKPDYIILIAALISFLFSISLWFGVFGAENRDAGIYVWQRNFLEQNSQMREFKVNAVVDSATRRIQKPETSTILQRIAEKDKTAVKDCIDTYGNFIWALAKKLTASREEAEAATEEIFIDIWQSCERAHNNQSIEKKLIAMIALRRLIKPLQLAKKKSMASIDSQNG